MAKMDENDDRRRMDKQVRRDDDRPAKSIGDKHRAFKSKSVSKGEPESRELPSKKPSKRPPERKDPVFAGGKKPKRAVETPGKEGKMDSPRMGESKSRAGAPGQAVPISCGGCGGSVLGAIIVIIAAVGWVGGLLS